MRPRTPRPPTSPPAPVCWPRFSPNWPTTRTKMRLGSRAAHRRAVSLALPLIAANVTVPLVGMVDTAVLGHLPEAHYLGAAALGGVVFSFLYFSFAFLRTGTTGPVAQAHGAGDAAEVKATLYRALLLA